jgi:hypothetical protein
MAIHWLPTIESRVTCWEPSCEHSCKRSWTGTCMCQTSFSCHPIVLLPLLHTHHAPRGNTHYRAYYHSLRGFISDTALAGCTAGMFCKYISCTDSLFNDTVMLLSPIRTIHEHRTVNVVGHGRGKILGTAHTALRNSRNPQRILPSSALLREVLPKRRYETTLRLVTAQKTEKFISSTAEAQDRPRRTLQ